MSGRKIHPLMVPFLVAVFITAAWVVGTWWQIPSFVWETEGIQVPAGAKTTTVKVRGMECRHRSETMKKLLFGRKDGYAVQGYLKAMIYPSPEAGDMIITYDPAKATLRDIANAVKYNQQGQETQDYRVLLAVKPDLSTPAALFRAISQALSDGHEELFNACHASGVLAKVNFKQVVEVFGGLFVDGLVHIGKPGPDGKVDVQAVSMDQTSPLSEYGIALKQVTIKQTAKGWLITEADWGAFRSEDM